MTVDYTTSYQIRGGVVVYTQWIDHDQTVVGRGGFPLSAVTAWHTERLKSVHGDEEDDVYAIHLNNRTTPLIFRFPFGQDHGEAWAGFDDHMLAAMSGAEQPANGWLGAGITTDSQGGGS